MRNSCAEEAHATKECFAKADSELGVTYAIKSLSGQDKGQVNGCIDWISKLKKC